MSYLTQSRMAQDYGLIMRIAACAAAEGELSPTGWADTHRQRLIATPGWDDAYEASATDNPGEDEAAVTDSMILAAVEQLRAELTPPPPPEEVI